MTNNRASRTAKVIISILEVVQTKTCHRKHVVATASIMADATVWETHSTLETVVLLGMVKIDYTPQQNIEWVSIAKLGLLQLELQPQEWEN